MMPENKMKKSAKNFLFRKYIRYLCIVDCNCIMIYGLRKGVNDRGLAQRSSARA